MTPWQVSELCSKFLGNINGREPEEKRAVKNEEVEISATFQLQKSISSSGKEHTSSQTTQAWEEGQ